MFAMHLCTHCYFRTVIIVLSTFLAPFPSFHTNTLVLCFRSQTTGGFSYALPKSSFSRYSIIMVSNTKYIFQPNRSPRSIHRHARHALAVTSSLNFSEIELTQCLSSVGVSKPSPLNTCPRCPPQAVQVISVLSIPMDVSSCLVTAPGIASKKAGHPQPELNLVVLLYRGVLQAAHEYTPSAL